MIPCWRLREERERATSEAQSVCGIEAELAEERRIQAGMATAARSAAAGAGEVPDFIADPAAYHAHIERTFSERLRNMEANFSFRIQHDRHGEAVRARLRTMIGMAERGDRTVAAP